MIQKLLSLKQMENIARKATRDALKDYANAPDLSDKNLTLGSGIEGTEGVFELYIAGERSRDARVLTCARVNRATGVVTVQVFLEKPSSTHDTND